MAEIELVVKIPEEAYELLKNEGVDWLGAEPILNAVANGAPLPKGHWIHHDGDICGICFEHWECSYCHETTMINPIYPYNTNNHMYYCPKCGADMREVKE